ncbi:pentatricopeptide repeat-containing protein At2g20710, mitochondrial-like [Camellia sinensis]|uniref:pentatricopeptide repeat-containing protein At2g20710, mitochondrial-like n=1 Tax=Camellia sinensis TaxID=4442 RepID=UPI0010365ED7|nr:pentatricopeptide repeat-containing protein At2g20710, mitochondrial-like [Camellia sinensis]
MRMMMMRRLLQSRTWCKHGGIARVLYCTETLTACSSSSSSSSSRDTLYSRISPLGDPRVSIEPILHQWVREGRVIEHQQLQMIIKLLRKFRRFKHALQVSEWMSDKSYFDLFPGDVAIRLDLISKVHGLEQAEDYFNHIPNALRVFPVYGALLNCYAHAKSLEKAEATMQKMRELGSRTPLVYNVMLKLYSQMGKHKKIDSLVQEMEEKGIACDKFTFSILLNSHAVTSDIKGMEKILMKMEADPVISMDWNAYVIAANGYLKAGLVEKGFSTLKKSEQLITVKSRKHAYEFLLTLYASMGNKDEVYHMWNLCKKSGKIYNTNYISMLSSLGKLDDLDGMEKLFEEWEINRTCFDFRVPNLMISAYCRKGLLEKAESIVNRLIESGKEPNTGTWERLSAGYNKYNHMEKAVDTLKKAILASHPIPGWKPDLPTFAGCLEYLKGKGDGEVAEFKNLLEEHDHFSTDTYDR